MTFVSQYLSSLGLIILESDDGNAISSLHIIKGKQLHPLLCPRESNEPKIFTRTKIWLDAYFSGEKVSPKDIPLAPRGGSSFARSIWNMLCLIPYGETTTYGELAKSIAAERGLKKMSAQAIGGAVGSNPIAIIIPCHRVIGAKGNLTGFGGGLDLKIKLLQIEKAYKPYFFAPNIKKSNNHHKNEPKQMHLDAIA